jgi:hypothetical protein
MEMLAMKYACLVYIDPATMGALTPEQGDKLRDDSIDYDWEMERSGRLLMAQPLDSPQTAVTVRVRNGRASHTDGPFAETREFLGGFFLVEARDLNEVVRIVEQDPMATMGSIEIRPFLEQTHGVTGAGRPKPRGAA